MLLRTLVLLLLLANGLYAAWSQGVLREAGLGPAQQTEPQRLAQQVRPQSLRLLREAPQAVAAAAAPSCLATGPLDETTVTALRPLLASWPAGSWSLEPATEPARWIVYMGRYPSADNLERKKAELRNRGVVFEPVANPNLEPGLLLGAFPAEPQARQHLAMLAGRGVHTATVLEERAELRGTALRLPEVDDALRARLESLRPALGAKPLRACS